MTMRKLYHYACHHSAAGIRRCGELRPHAHPWLPLPLVWLTDLDKPWRNALGLTSHTIACDRTEYRFAARDTSTAIPWTTYRRSVPIRAAVALESAPGVMPAHWWVSTVPVPVSPEERP
jgi:hypothetical protein